MSSSKVTQCVVYIFLLTLTHLICFNLRSYIFEYEIGKPKAMLSIIYVYMYIYMLLTSFFSLNTKMLKDGIQRAMNKSREQTSRVRALKDKWDGKFAKPSNCK